MSILEVSSQKIPFFVLATPSQNRKFKFYFELKHIFGYLKIVEYLQKMINFGLNYIYNKLS